MENIQGENIRQKPPYILIGIIKAVFLVFILVFIFKNNSEKKQTTTLSQNQVTNFIPSPTTSQITPLIEALTLTLSSQQKVFLLNDNINIDIYAQSEGKNISGYDLLISYDSQGLEFINAASALDDFSLYFFKKEGYLTLTGTKKLSSNNPTVFTSTKIVTLTFKPKNRGKFKISLVESYQKEKSQLVDDQTNIYYPILNQLEIEIK